MLEVTIPSQELWDERKQEFIYTKAQTLQLEHSLVSLAKWESHWNKPFLVKGNKTYEETVDYIRCMTITQNVPSEVYNYITNEIVDSVRKYIEAPMTATTFAKRPDDKKNREIITAEIIYYWMITYNIPVEFQKWHLNRLLTLIQVLNNKNQPEKKMSKKEIYELYNDLNEKRKKELGTNG